MARRLKVGIIGTGQIGKSHLRKYQDIPEAEVVAVCDIREDEAQRVAEQFGVPHVFADYHELLKVDEIESVDVCLHNKLHCPVTCDALEAGKHVYCEKPLALSAAEAQRMVETAERVGKKMQMQLNTLFTPEAQTAKRLIEKGVLGRVYYAKTSHYRRRGRPYVDGYGTAHFVQKDWAGGGALNDMGVYHLGLMVWLLGNPELESVTASSFQELPMDARRRKKSGYDVEETMVGLVRFEGDVTLFFEESWAIHAEGGDGDRVLGSKGGLKLDPLTVYTDLGGVEADAQIAMGSFENRQRLMDQRHPGLRDTQRHYVWAVLGKVPWINTGRIGLRVCEISEAMYRSAAVRAEVKWGK